jgi:hypothetical protein
MRFLVSAGVLVAASAPLHADPAIRLPEPVVAIDDLRTHAPVLYERYQVGATYRYVLEGDNADLTALQIGLGPMKHKRSQLRQTLSWMHDYALRLRFTAIDLAGDDRRFGPITVGLQRYARVAPVAIAPLLHLHYGVEVAVSSPWASGREELPDPALAAAMGVETELASNGWSLRPATAYVRADLLMCRSIAVELGAGPEAFVTTIPNLENEYGVRFRGLLGFSLGPCHKRNSWRKNIDVVIQYRGRARLYSDDAAPDIFNELGLELQRRGWLNLGLFGTTDFGSSDGFTFGARLQLGGR